MTTMRRVGPIGMPVLPAWSGWTSNLLGMAAGFGMLLLVWTLIAWRLGNAVLLPVPLAVLEGFSMLLRDGSLISDILASLKRVFVGFLIAAVIAVPLAMLLAYSRPLCRAVLPVINLIRPTPIPLEFDVDSRWFGRRFLDSEYERLIDTGIIKEGEPIELLDGILVRKMSKSPPHRIATRLARRILG